MTTEDSPVVTLTAIRARVAALQEQLEELHRKVKRVLALKSVIEHSFQTDGSRLQDVRAHYAGLSEALTKIANGDRRESEVLSLVRQAFTQCDAISAISWAPDFFVCPLLTLPEPCITSYIGPFLGTQSIVGSLSRTHTSLHALSHNPAIHTNMHLQTDEYPGIVITKQQIAAWGTALSKVTRATVLCWPTSAVLELLERASNVLEELYASEPWETPSHLAAPLADRGLREDRIVFPKLIRAEVAGEWITVAHRRNWEPTAPKDLSVRRVESWSHVVGTGAWLAGPGPHSLTLKARFAHGVEFDMVRNLLWTRFRRLVGVGVDLKLHRREAIRNPPLTADMTLAGVPYGDPRSADIRRLSAYAKTPFQQRTGEAMQLEELGVVVNEIHDTMLAAVQVLRSRQLAPRGKVTFDVMPSVEFHTMDILRYLEADPSSADTLTELALCVKSVALPSGLAQGQTVSSAAPYCLPQLVFSRATQLELQGCGAASEPLPAYFLEHICDRHFPRITTLDLGKVEGAREEAARKAVDLPSLREVRFETNRSPLCLRGCQKGLPLVHVKGSYRASGAGVWSLWEGGDEGAEDGHQRGLEKRIRKITITVRHPEEEPEGALPVKPTRP
ncbi:unnamed protein product [Vitrella brassicaformis CCMP3155]|uniref:Uncharacterized protein n=1 Tax=Vitrella brassicaformis (strain CCMP3155) TaxID=1169540 RepID=A0A0G4EKH2_VITBC|nr:unnamed protein product [Vitrella brassicaformis CCMP3155]|eukprot:CEL97505.1 unnamed protein product [Vitrella brassicaformis CCMP3155]